MSKKVKLATGQTMAQYERQQEFIKDCMDVAMLIDRKPGIPSKWAIADELGLSMIRVGACIGEINDDQSPYVAVEYGMKAPKGGPFASGDPVRGWFPMKRAVYHDVMGQANDRAISIEIGVRKKRVKLALTARGFTSVQAGLVLDGILKSLDLDVAKMTSQDWDAIYELAMEAPLK